MEWPTDRRCRRLPRRPRADDFCGSRLPIGLGAGNYPHQVASESRSCKADVAHLRQRHRACVIAAILAGCRTRGDCMLRPINWSFALPYYAAALAFGYLLGSIPFGLILTRLAGTEDIRAIG